VNVDRSISRPGLIAAVTTFICLSVAIGVALVTSFDEFMCREPIRCASHGAWVSIGWLFLVPAAIGTARLGWSLRRRTVVEELEDAWPWALSALFIAGAWLMAAKIPSETCGAGYHLDRVADVCIGATGGFVDPRSWVLLRLALLTTALVAGCTVIRSGRATIIMAPIAAATWFAGTMWWIWSAFIR